jgi:hypothetical protein
MAAVRSEVGFEAAACSEVEVCFGTGIKDDWRRWQDGV